VKVIPIALQSHYEGRALSVSFGLKFTWQDGEVFAFTSRQKDVLIDGVTYLSAPNANMAAIAAKAGFSLDNTEAKTIITDDAITEADVLAGLWGGAEWELIRFNNRDTLDGVEIVKTGKLGPVTLTADQITSKLRGMAVDEQVNIGLRTVSTCTLAFGSARCGVDLGPITVAGTLTNVTSRYAVRDSARAEASDYFGNGILRMIDGANAGIERHVKTYAANGTVTLWQALPYDAQVGDAYELVPGCRKRRTEDCATNWSNGPRFGGMPDLVGVDRLVRQPDYE
jgi:uncharacterized phage protein (TIGR02218 family)